MCNLCGVCYLRSLHNLSCGFCMCFFFLNRGNTEGTNSSKMCLMFVYVFCKVVSGLFLGEVGWGWGGGGGDNLWFDDLCAELIGHGLSIAFSHDVTLCG